MPQGSRAVHRGGIAKIPNDRACPAEATRLERPVEAAAAAPYLSGCGHCVVVHDAFRCGTHFIDNAGVKLVAALLTVGGLAGAAQAPAPTPTPHTAEHHVFVIDNF